METSMQSLPSISDWMFDSSKLGQPRLLLLRMFSCIEPATATSRGVLPSNNRTFLTSRAVVCCLKVPSAFAAGRGRGQRCIVEALPAPSPSGRRRWMDPDPEALEHLDAAELRAEEVRGTGSGGVVPGGRRRWPRARRSSMRQVEAHVQERRRRRRPQI